MWWLQIITIHNTAPSSRKQLCSQWDKAIGVKILSIAYYSLGLCKTGFDPKYHFVLSVSLFNWLNDIINMQEDNNTLGLGHHVDDTLKLHHGMTVEFQVSCDV